MGVALYDDRLEIISIGDLHFGLTPEALFLEHESRPWNPMIARTFYRRGIIETWGRGTLKIARLMHERGLAPPTMAVRAGAVVVTFQVSVTEKTLEKTLEKTPEKAKTREKMSEKMSEKTDAAVLRQLSTQPDLNIAELARLLAKTPRTIERAIKQLRESGRLQRIGPDKGGHWQVIE